MKNKRRSTNPKKATEHIVPWLLLFRIENYNNAFTKNQLS